MAPFPSHESRLHKSSVAASNVISQTIFVQPSTELDKTMIVNTDDRSEPLYADASVKGSGHEPRVCLFTRPLEAQAQCQKSPNSPIQDSTLPNDADSAPDLNNAAFFPWHRQSLRDLWGGRRITTWPSANPGDPPKETPGQQTPLGVHEVWSRIVNRWMGCIAVCAGNELRLVQTRDNVLRTVRHLRIPMEDVRTVTWALDFDTLHPLVVFAGRQAIVRIIDVESWERVGAITGHGGPITHLTTHPTRPNYVFSTSQDWTARMWSLADPVNTPAVPAHWPGHNKAIVQQTQGKRVLREVEQDMNQKRSEDLPPFALPSQTGPAGGILDRESGGHGKGLCVAIFKGTAAGLGGHQSWVLSADFHPTKPFVMTGGADRAIKIWRLPDFATPENGGIKVNTIELPIFSTTHIHEGGVDYVRWVTANLIVSKSRVTRTYKNDFHGTVALWRWLDLAHFAPNDPQPQERTAARSFTDYTESRSYRMVLDIQTPIESEDVDSVWRLDVCTARQSIVLASELSTVHLIDMHKHLSTPEMLKMYARPSEAKNQRKGRKRAMFHPVDLTDVSHALIHARGWDPEMDFRFLTAVINPLNPRVLVGMGINGIIALWFEENDMI